MLSKLYAVVLVLLTIHIATPLGNAQSTKPQDTLVHIGERDVECSGTWTSKKSREVNGPMTTKYFSHGKTEYRVTDHDGTVYQFSGQFRKENDNLIVEFPFGRVDTYNSVGTNGLEGSYVNRKKIPWADVTMSCK